MGGAQPLAVKMAGGVCIAVECDEKRIDRRTKAGFCDKKIKDIDEAVKIAESAKKEGKALSIGLLGNCADVHPKLVKDGFKPDVVTDASIGGIIRPDRVKELEQAAAVRGYLVAAGGKAFEDFGEPIPKIGDRVQFAKYAGVHEVPGAYGESYLMCNDKDIAAIIIQEELAIKKTKNWKDGTEVYVEEKYRFNPETGNYEREE